MCAALSALYRMPSCRAQEKFYLYFAVRVTWLAPFVLVGLIGVIMFGEILIVEILTQPASPSC
jgi:hypothetical protein